MKTTKSQIATSSLLINVATWKIATLVKAYEIAKRTPPSMLTSVHTGILANKPQSYELMQKVYAAGMADIPVPCKIIDRIGYMRLELLNLMQSFKDAETTVSLNNAIVELLKIVPDSNTNYLRTEVKYAKTIDSLLPSQLAYGCTAIMNKDQPITYGIISNHYFNMVNFGRAQKNKADKETIVTLLRNQHRLLELLNGSHLAYPLTKELVTIMHWLPADMAKVKGLIADYDKVIEYAACKEALKPKAIV